MANKRISLKTLIEFIVSALWHQFTLTIHWNWYFSVSVQLGNLFTNWLALRYIHDLLVLGLFFPELWVTWILIAFVNYSTIVVVSFFCSLRYRSSSYLINDWTGRCNYLLYCMLYNDYIEREKRKKWLTFVLSFSIINQ